MSCLCFERWTAFLGPLINLSKKERQSKDPLLYWSVYKMMLDIHGGNRKTRAQDSDNFIDDKN